MDKFTEGEYTFFSFFPQPVTPPARETTVTFDGRSLEGGYDPSVLWVKGPYRLT